MMIAMTTPGMGFGSGRQYIGEPFEKEAIWLSDSSALHAKAGELTGQLSLLVA